KLGYPRRHPRATALPLSLEVRAPSASLEGWATGRRSFEARKSAHLVLEIFASFVLVPQGTTRSGQPPGSGQSIDGSFAPQSEGLFLSKITIGSSSGPDG
ncbi:MAG: hypothetical protein ACREEK_08945, partial [Bradyrhizobium sp.]